MSKALFPLIIETRAPNTSDTEVFGYRKGQEWFNSVTGFKYICTNEVTGTWVASGASATVDWSNVTSKPTTLSGYGITDAQPLDGDLTAIAALSTTAFGRSFLAQADAASTRSTLSVPSYSEISAAYQPLDGDLTAIAGLAGTSGFLKKTGTNTWTLDTSNYITNSQIITYASTTSTSSLALDLSNQQSLYLISALAANLTVTTSNRSAGKVYGLRIKDNGTSRSLAFPSWTWMRPAPTSTVTSKWIVVTIECFGTNDTDIIADWTTEDANVYTTYGKSLVTSADAAAARTLLGVDSTAVLNAAQTWSQEQTFTAMALNGFTESAVANFAIRCGSNPRGYLNYIGTDTGLGNRVGRIEIDYANAPGGFAFTFAGAYDPLVIHPSGSVGFRVTPTAGNGLLQLYTGTTKDNGIAHGDTYQFRYTVGGIAQTGPTNNDVVYAVKRSTGESTILAVINGRGYIGTDSNHALSLVVNNQTAISIEANKNCFFYGTATINIGNVASTTLLRMRGGVGSHFSIDASQGGGSEWVIGDGVGAANGTFVIRDSTNSRNLILCDANGNIGLYGNTIFYNNLQIIGSTTLSTLGTSGLATLNSASVTTTLGVTGNTTLSTLTTTGAATLGGSSAPAPNTFAGNKIWGVTNATGSVAGQVGEELSVYTTGSPVNGSITNIASIILQAGVWAVSFCVQIVNTTGANSGTISSEIAFNSISNSSLVGNYADNYLANTYLNVPTSVNLYQLISSAPKIIQVTTSITHYLNARVSAPTGTTISAYIKISAIRIR